MRIIFSFCIFCLWNSNHLIASAEVANIHILCKSENLPDILEIDIVNDTIKLSNQYIENLDYAKFKVSESELFINWKDKEREFRDGRYQIMKMHINRYTGRFKQEIINYFPNSLKEKQSDPYILNGICESFKERKF